MVVAAADVEYFVVMVAEYCVAGVANDLFNVKHGQSVLSDVVGLQVKHSPALSADGLAASLDAEFARLLVVAVLECLLQVLLVELRSVMASAHLPLLRLQAQDLLHSATAEGAATLPLATPRQAVLILVKASLAHCSAALFGHADRLEAEELIKGGFAPMLRLLLESRYKLSHNYTYVDSILLL